MDIENLHNPFNDPGLRKAMEGLQIMSQYEVEWARYQSRLKFQRDQNMYLKDATEKGEILGKITLCQRLLKLPLTSQEDLVARPLDELYAMATDLEQQVAARIS